MVAADVQRPAAVEQLKVLGQQLDIPVYFEVNSQPVKICKNAVKHAKENSNDVVIFDTAGRLHIDDELMSELKEIKGKLEPQQIYFVCDSMTGQDAVNSAKEFDTQLGFDGVILTKLDGDTRGGAGADGAAVHLRPARSAGGNGARPGPGEPRLHPGRRHGFLDSPGRRPRLVPGDGLVLRRSDGPDAGPAVSRDLRHPARRSRRQRRSRLRLRHRDAVAVVLRTAGFRGPEGAAPVGRFRRSLGARAGRFASPGSAC